jgi:hypothetical protein
MPNTLLDLGGRPRQIEMNDQVSNLEITPLAT